MGFTQTDAVEVKQIRGKGRGVFARRDIPEGDLIERVPVLVIPTHEIGDASRQTGLWEYSFEWGKGTVALALGYGSLYNHSYRPNARVQVEGQRTKLFVARRDIVAGEEITINYNGEANDRSKLWFEVVGDPAPGRSRAR